MQATVAGQIDLENKGLSGLAQLRENWRGTPQVYRLDVKRELGLQHDLSDPVVLAAHGIIPVPFAARCPQDKKQDVAVETITCVEFLGSSGDAFVLGHSRGKLSFWRLAATAASPTQRNSSSTSPYDACVVGSLRMAARKYEVQGLSAAPAATELVAEEALAAEVWLAVAVGPAAVVLECGNAASGSWSPPPECRARLDHSHVCSREDDEVMSVLLSRCGACWRVMTVAEDGYLRVWELQRDIAGKEADGASTVDHSAHGQLHWNQVLLWSLDGGDARQMRMSVLPSAHVAFDASISHEGMGMPAGDVMACDADKQKQLLAVARSDKQSLEIFLLSTGQLLGVAHAVWPEGSMPQTVVFDTVGCKALCSSLAASGEALTKLIHLDVAPQAAPPIEDCPFAGVGRRLVLALPVPVADVVVALVGLGGSHLWLEVWESCDVFGNSPGGQGKACYRGRLPTSSVYPGLTAAGGCRLLLLDPVALMTRGELRILEWQRDTRAQAAQRDELKQKSTPPPPQLLLSCFPSADCAHCAVQ